MEAVIYISIICFLLVPYYLSIFLLNRTTIKKHIVLWLCIHGVFAVISGVIYSYWFSLSTIALIGCGLYFICSYIYYGRDMWKPVSVDNMARVVNHKGYKMLEVVILAIEGLFVVVDISLIVTVVSNDLKLLEKYYLGSIVILSFLQTIYYLKKMKQKFGIEVEHR